MNFSIITYFPIANGGMKLLRLNDNDKTTILKDINIRDTSASEEDICDVSQELRDRLPKDSNNRPYVDAFILTHHHDDHLRGLQEHFHLGSIDDYTELKGDEEAKELSGSCGDTRGFGRGIRKLSPYP